MDESILTLKNISKSYPGVQALDQVSIEFKRGEVHSIVGENGAGKSTLIKTITGAIEPTSGTIVYQGKEMQSVNPIFALKEGISAIYQEFNLIPSLTVAENIFYGREISGRFFLNRREMNQQAERILSQLGVHIPPQSIVKELSVGFQQIVEIAKSISAHAKVLIMDEPTAPLTASEVAKLYEIVGRLKQSGMTVIYISHKFDEIFHLSDRITVMRDGKYITTLQCKDTNKEQLVSLMVGRSLGQDYPAKSAGSGAVILEVKGISNEKIHNISFDLREKEILGIAGLVGAGRTELARAIFGADAIAKGGIYIRGQIVKFKQPRDAIKHKLGLIPEDRKQHGALLNMDIKFNISYPSLGKFTKAGMLQPSQEKQLAADYIKMLAIRTPNEQQLVKNLSGGNQQKVVLAKWLAMHCDILIFDEPTRGIDVGAKQEIYTLMRDLVNQGKSIIMISSEMPELIGMSDRILVMKDGRLTGEIKGSDMTQEHILTMATSDLPSDLR
ncbi:sugar ABC transporter ATP-binding protein [Paenibacillus eucommiae]|uniref:Ribose transport system ATP-binding protein n=1 Tax=Paenibacillus eucommiae TaxID=1355755 RepID=A0ABS4J224_9BACL|nr:sugar ABC transporter ATP-binding protein [Paenibacillus eucommiae]MBP1993867.1 ribose transport system ATP-binding protein [Paenibacillus eucommiae]